MLEAASRKAENVLLEQRLFNLNTATFDALEVSCTAQ